jgi:hypothetical protein
VIETPFMSLFIPLSAALGLSVIVERILEFAQNIFETIPLRTNTIQIPKTKSPEELDAIAEKTREYDQKAKVSHIDEQYQVPPILVENAKDPDDGKAFKRCILMLFGFAIGVVFAFFADLKLFRVIIPGMTGALGWLDHILTGLLIGGGSAPVHSIINFIVERKSVLDVVTAQKEEKAIVTLPAKPAAEAIVIPSVSIIPSRDSYAWIDIPYDGGVDWRILEHAHKRPKNPNCVIYHHTAMHSDSTFQDVVNVIKAKTYDITRVVNGEKIKEKAHWLTGYNCVILADGSIHPFCRWDRAGIHAGDMNGTSLGISFNGNFETNPRAGGANIGNKYGIDRPTDAQLKSGARVIALWILLYNIDYAASFRSAIIPHKEAIGADTVCPGSNFPYQELERLVRCYRDSWTKSDEQRRFIEEYKTKPYIYKEVV